MARSFMPRGHIERREHQDLGLFSGVTPRESKFKTDRVPGQHAGKMTKLSEYGKQLRAKQSAKRLYGVLERQFRNYYRKACRLSGSTGLNLLNLLEMRLDNVVYRLGLARTRKEARQLISHGSIVVVTDGDRKRTINIPSFQVRPGYEIAVKEKSQKQLRIQEALELAKVRILPEWLENDPQNFKGTVKRLPERSEMPSEINELLIVELYSK